MSKKSILLLATERSGTNLLRAILSTHSQISSPPPFSMIDVLVPTSYKYFGDGDHFDVLIDDAIQLTRTHLNPWDIECKHEEVKQKIQNRTLWELFKVLNEYYAAFENKQNWLSKEPGLFKYIYQFAMHIPQAKFIYLVRDPRDVVASMLDGDVHEHNVFHAANRWRNEQIYCLNAYQDSLLGGRIFKLHYEDLLQDSERVVRSLMDFIGVPFEPEQLMFYKNEKIIAHSTKSEFWRNLNKPIVKDNKGNFLRKLSNGQISIIESICWDEMVTLGYQPISSAPRKIPFYLRFIYIAHTFIKKMMKSFRFSSEGKKHRQRRKSAKSIKNRSFLR